MAEIVTTIDIDASPERVWQILADTAAYDEWNPFVTRVRGQLDPAQPFRFMAPLGKRDIAIDAKVIVVDEPREIRWRGPRNAALAKLFWGEHYFKIERRDGDKARFVHGETFGGVITALFWSKLEKRVRPLYTSMNEALKRRAEAS